MTSRLAANRYTRPLILFGIITLAALALNFIPSPWTAWRPSLCFPRCFCETIGNGAVRQPANTYSNLGYVLVGLLIALSAPAIAPEPTEKRNLLQSQRGYVLLYGWAVVSIGVGSLFYHASMTYIGQFFDWVGMYAFISFVVVYNAVRLMGRPVPGLLFGAVYTLLLTALCVNFFINPELRVGIFQNLIIVGLGIEAVVLLIRRPRVQILYLVAAIACLVAARVIWGWDADGTLCTPGSLLQGHAAWHLLTAAATALLYPYYLSEQPR